MTAKEVEKALSRFFKDKLVTKENGKEYKPSSLTSFRRSFQWYFSEKKLPFNIFDLDDSVKDLSASNIQNAVTLVNSSYLSTSNALEAIFAGANISSVLDCTFQIMTGPVNIVNEAA